MESLICTSDGDRKFATSAENATVRSSSAAIPIAQHSSMNGRVVANGSLSSSISSFRLSVGSASSGENDIQHIKASDAFPKRATWVEDSGICTQPPFPLLPGEYISYEGRTVEGSLFISNYRLYQFKTPTGENGILANVNKDINVPVGLIETIECKDIFYLNIYCKDARSFRLVFSSGDSCQDWAKRLIQCLNLPRKRDEVFSLAFFAWARDTDEINAKGGTSSTTAGSVVPWWQRPSNREQPLTGEKLFRFELERLGYDTKETWRISTINADFKLCSSYPSHLIVPMTISDEKLECVASFRSVRRLPAIVWRNRRNGAVLARCSQPEVGWLGWTRSTEDESLLSAILDACYYDSNRNTSRLRESSPLENSSSSREGDWTTDGTAHENGIIEASPPNECGSLKDLSEDSSCFTQGRKKMLIVDARSYATAVANRARGGGCEFPQYYPQCDIEFMNLANIHAVRKSFLLLRSLCLTVVNPPAAADQSNWFTQLDSTRWLHHMANLLRASWYTAINLEEQGRPVLVHCSDGWDRTPQIVSLAQLMIDPFYRTFQGFQALVQREWLEFGHKFADRCGLWGGCEDLNERCPVFLQFLDCVHQLMKQFPTAFQFNHAYLVKMVQHVYSNLFGTFLWNTIQERNLQNVADQSHSLWMFLLEKSADFCNYLYEYSEEPLWPSYQVRDLHFWSAVYLADLGSTGCTVDGCHGNPSANNPKTNSNSPCSSGYATPQQTALTDSMVDTLPWKNLTIKEQSPSVRNAMEDSTDTLVDDGTKAPAILPVEPEDLETIENFPLLEPASPGLDSCQETNKIEAIPASFVPKRNPSQEFNPASQTLFAPFVGEESSDEVDGRFNSDCKTCQENWNLLNRNQGSCGVASDSINGHPSSSAESDSLFRRGLLAGTSKTHNPPCLNFDLDGLLPCFDRQQVRLRQILALKEMEIEALRRDLRNTRVALCRQVCHTCSSSRHNNRRPAFNKEDLSLETSDCSLPISQSQQDPCDDGVALDIPSISSWETVNEKEIDEKVALGSTTLWVPDHAAPVCMKCAVPFRMGRRRHHCRNCGKVFCSECTGYELPLPHQNLNQAVRVCNTCYDQLTRTKAEPTDNTLDGNSTPTFRPKQLSNGSTTVHQMARAVSLSNLTASVHCSAQCCRLKRSSTKIVTAASN